VHGIWSTLWSGRKVCDVRAGEGWGDWKQLDIWSYFTCNTHASALISAARLAPHAGSQAAAVKKCAAHGGVACSYLAATQRQASAVACRPHDGGEPVARQRSRQATPRNSTSEGRLSRLAARAMPSTAEARSPGLTAAPITTSPLGRSWAPACNQLG
jgi:hypothetical protein